MSDIPDLSVVLPTLDEAQGLSIVIPRIRTVFEKLGIDGEILVVDGGSRDATVETAKSLGARVMRQQGRGFGSAVREGIQAARAEFIALMDADGSHDPSALETFWRRRKEAELIVGSRYCLGGSAAMPLSRQILSRSLNLVTKRALRLPVRESSSGYRLYHGPSVKAVASDATDFSVQQDLLVGILSGGGRVIESPIHYAPRVGGKSKANAWKLAPAYARLLLRLKSRRGGWRQEAGLISALATTLGIGLAGITGGLPGCSRMRALPPGLSGSPDFSNRLADAWRSLYRDIDRAHQEMRSDEPRTGVSGVVTIAPNWNFPPDELVNSARALLTQSVNPDEKKSFIIMARMRPWRLEMQPLYAVYGGAFIYPLGAFLGAAHLFHLARLTPNLEHYLAVPDDMARLYVIGRLYTLMFHLGTVWMLFELGCILSGPFAGTSAAFFWALSPVAVVNSHVLKPHPVSAFWVVAAVYCMVRAVEEGRWVDYLLCGAGAGLGAGGNLSVGFALGLPVLARVMRREGSWRACLGGVAVGIVILIMMNPYPFFASGQYAWERAAYTPSHFIPTLSGLAAFVTLLVPQGLGPCLGLLAGLGIARSCASDDRRRATALFVLGGGGLVLGAFPQFALLISSLRLHYAVAAVAVVLAADFLAALPRRAAWPLLIAALVDTGLRGGMYTANLIREAGPWSTRSLAADWIDLNVPPGDTVGLLRYPEPAHTPAFRWDRVKLVIFESTRDLSGRRLPEWIVADRSGWSSVEEEFRKKYDEARGFAPASLAWASPSDDSFFSNAGMVVLRRNKS